MTDLNKQKSRIGVSKRETSPRYIHSCCEAESDLRSARTVIGHLERIIQPKSVLDVGCGLGHFCRVFLDSGVGRVLGVDGDYLDRSKLLIPVTNFKTLDLTSPFDLGEKFDLVVSLEVAEHLPIESAEKFVESLVRHGRTILFSAAFPRQGGQKHLNEQWAGWWAEKFLLHGYRGYDYIRPQVLNCPGLPPWYRFNPILFSTENSLVAGPMKVDFFEHVLTGGLGIKLSLRCLTSALRRRFLR